MTISKNIKTIPITNKQDWLENRLLDVTSTEISCLFNCNPYLTEFELYHQKKDKVVVNLEDTERMAWGRKLEDSIALGCAESQGWKVEQMDVYMSDSQGMGSSFDYKITSEKELGIMEVKNVSEYIYKTKWIEENDNLEAPPHIEMQLQYQLHVADINWGCIAALVGGNTQKLIIRERNREMGKRFDAVVKKFWDRVKSGTPPATNYERDSNYMIKNLFNHADSSLIMNADAEMDQLVKDYHAVNKEFASLSKTKDSIKAQILEKSQGASKIISEYGTINCGMTKASQGKYITEDMVGTFINQRKSFRQFKYNQPKGV
tara:strand:+ start:180 stop:1133 length:954 start_codon:yes stop_codon:yes gene_type:complete